MAKPIGVPTGEISVHAVRTTNSEVSRSIGQSNERIGGEHAISRP